MQFIELYEEEDDDRKYPYYHKSEDYEFITSINIKEHFKIQAPYSYELFFLFKNYISIHVKDFKPELIVFIEDFPADMTVMEQPVRAMLLAETFENINNKVYYLKEVGIHDRVCQ